MHYSKTGKEERDRSAVGIWFARAPVERHFASYPLATRGLRIPAGAARHEVRNSVRLPIAVDVHTVMPHMHLLGRTIEVTATLPDGTRAEVIRIDEWDFDWQLTYANAQPMRLPRGTVLDLVATFDNSEGNPRNPNRPPKLVHWGERTTDEMCLVFLGVTLPENPQLDLGDLLGRRFGR
jgi:hypothetical protein